MTPVPIPSAAPAPTLTTNLRALTLNTRLPSLSAAKADDNDLDISVRLSKLLTLVKGFAPSIACLQECDVKLTLAPLLAGLGKTWTSDGIGKVHVAWDGAKWRKVGPSRIVNMPNGGEAERRLVIVKLQSIKTGGTIFVLATHLGVHMTNEAKVRIGQAEQIVAELQAYGADEECAVLIGGDFNDVPAADKAGVRQVFAQSAFALQDLRSRLTDASLYHRSNDTAHGYGKRQTRSRWLDDLLTGGTLRPVEGWVLLTDSEAPTDVRHATDHNAVAARLQFESEVRP
ncbi:hypothetical protein GCM10009616_35600 [Microlunatus lacustris]